MDYLTQYYKNKTEELQERYEFLYYELKMLAEDISSMTDADIEEWIKGNAQNPEQANQFRETLKKRRASKNGAPKAETPKAETPKAETPKAKTSKNVPTSPPSS